MPSSSARHSIDAVQAPAEAIATLADGTVVAARQGNLLATSFHPELTGRQRLHELFLSMGRKPAEAPHERTAAETLSPIDAATLWPQLPRLDTEVIATRGGENLFVTSGLAATGLTRLPRIARLPRTAVLGVKRGLGYRGVLVSARARRRRRLGNARPAARRATKDDDAIIALVDGAAGETARRGGRTMYLRYAEGSPHGDAIAPGGYVRLSPRASLRLPPRRPRPPAALPCQHQRGPPRHLPALLPRRARERPPAGSADAAGLARRARFVRLRPRVRAGPRRHPRRLGRHRRTRSACACR